jgi:hypothetical protein
MFQHYQKLCVLGLMGITISIGFPRAAIAQVTQATIIEILDGDQVFINSQKARRNAVGRFNQTVGTRSARTGIRFDTPGGARLDRNSSMIVGKCVRLERGRAVVSGKMGRNGCVGNVEIRPRGTVYVMEMGDDGQGRVTVLEGAVEVFNPENPNGVAIGLSTGESVSIATDGQISSIQKSSDSQLQSISAALFEGFQQPLPELEKVALLKPIPPEKVAPLTSDENEFLADALFGRDHYTDGVKGQNNNEAFLSISGEFIKLNQEVSFSPNSPFQAPLDPSQAPNPVSQVTFSGDFENGTLTSVTLGAAALFPSRAIAGLSGNNAIGEITLSNGRVIRAVVFGINGQSIVDNQPYPGVLLFAPGSLNTIGPGRRDR